MAVKWTSNGIFLRGKLVSGTPSARVALEQIDGDRHSPEEGMWCVRVNGECKNIHVKGLKRAKIRGTRYLVGCLKLKK